jgi:NAD(P)-dependent dehydrogenase (short-subunit alcohol dehydrogenase family)
LPFLVGSDYTKIIHSDTYPGIDPKTRSNCSGKRVFITGASRGIGRAVAVSYAIAGASHIALAARSSLEETERAIHATVKEHGLRQPKITSLHLDVCDRENVKACVQTIGKEFDYIDILINNAGFLAEFIPIGDSDEDEYWRSWEVNILGTYLVTKFCLPLILKGGDKTIVNISTVGALGIFKGGSSYSTSKLALLRFSEFLSADYEEDVSN